MQLIDRFHLLLLPGCNLNKGECPLMEVHMLLFLHYLPSAIRRYLYSDLRMQEILIEIF